MKNRMDTNQIKIVTMLATIPRGGAGGIPFQKMRIAILTKVIKRANPEIIKF
jgi:hypothetical protein